MRMRTLLVLMLLTGLVLFGTEAIGQESDTEGEPPSADQPAAKQVKEKKPAKSNLPLNFYGRSGLLLTSSTHVLEFKDVEPAIGYMYESSSDPQYTTQTYAANLAVGLPRHVMLYAHVPIIMTDLHWGERFNAINVRVRDFSQKSKTDFGSVEGGFQWAFFMQDRFLPGMAAGLSFLAPTGDYTQHLSEVKTYGFKVNLTMGLEIMDLFFTEYAFAIFADGSAVFRDLYIEDREYEEKYGIVRAGMLFPIAPRNFLNLLLEYDGKLMSGTTNRDDHNGFVVGLRFITNRIGVSAGGEYLLKEAEDMGDAFRIIGTGSYRFW